MSLQNTIIKSGRICSEILGRGIKVSRSLKKLGAREILLPINVPIPQRSATYGTCPKLYFGDVIGRFQRLKGNVI